MHRIIYACDDNYAALTAVSAVSLLRYNPGSEIILLGYRLQDESKDIVRLRVEKNGGKFRYVDVSAAVARLEQINATSYVSYAVYSRLFIPELLPNEHGTVLYLDGDTLVNGPLDELFATKLDNLPLALAPDVVHPAYKRVICLPEDKPYFNSGVLLMDLDSWRARRCTERLLEELNHPHGRNPLGDQDVIVRVLNDEIRTLEIKWNFLSQYFLLRRQDAPGIYHFSGHTLGRPWYTSSRHPMRKAYRKAAVAADLPRFAEQIRPMAFEYKIQYWLFLLLPSFLFKPVCSLMYRVHIRLTYGV